MHQNSAKYRGGGHKRLQKNSQFLVRLIKENIPTTMILLNVDERGGEGFSGLITQYLAAGVYTLTQYCKMKTMHVSCKTEVRS
jgi:hypothetical protein